MILNAGWKLKIRDRIWKDLARIPRKDCESILEVIENEIISNPYSGDIEKMKGEDNSWRRRVGSYRIFYEVIVKEKAIYIFRIERRSSNTY